MRPNKRRQKLLQEFHELSVNIGVLLERGFHCVRTPIYDDIGFVHDELDKVTKKLYQALSPRKKKKHGVDLPPNSTLSQ
jgi:hypothetical protein